jgi:diguanylate cyclase (GGDEF)-like protein
MHLVVLRSRSLTGADAAVIELVDGDELVSKVAAGAAEGHPDLRFRRDSSLSGMCLTLGQALRSDDTTADPRVDRKLCARVGAGSMVCVPLRQDAAVTGVLKVYSAASHAFDVNDEQALELLSGPLEAAMTNATRLAKEAEPSGRDELTRLFNRRAYDERLVHEAERARRYEHPLGLVLLDIDGFEAVNRELGSPAGDGVLTRIAEILAASRYADAAFRIGGDEFAVLLPETGLVGAEVVGARLAEQIGAAGLGGGRVTVSWGAASHEGDPLVLHERADMRLLAAKFGRGRRFASDADAESDAA